MFIQIIAGFADSHKLYFKWYIDCYRQSEKKFSINYIKRHNVIRMLYTITSL